MKAKIGIVGTGWWACFNHIPTIQASSEAQIVALCDRDSDRLQIVGEKFGLTTRYTDIAAMLAAEQLDGVVVSTPHVAHTAPAIAALAAGCHVLVEKPMATTAADGRAIAAAAVQAGREVLVPTGLNFTRCAKQAADWVQAGRLGVIRHAVCQMGSALNDLFAGEPMLETADHLFRPPPSTWADPQQSGGYGWGQMSHSVAWLVYVTDLSFASAFCIDGKSKAGVDYYDAAVARATNGATIALSGSATVPKHRGMHTDIRIYGDKGMLVFDNERARLSIHLHDGTDEDAGMTQQEAEYDGALPVQVFARLCAGQKVVNASDGECGARVTEALDALYRSAATGTLATIKN